MENLILSKEDHSSFTVISNCFIDHFMSDANDVQLKIYLFLLRTIQSGKTTDITEMADCFNYSEKDVMRALKYWDKKELLSLSFNSSKELTGILFRTPSGKSKKASNKDSVQVSDSVVINTTDDNVCLDDVKAFKNNQSTNELIMITEQYIGRPLTPKEVQTIVYIYTKLRFSNDLLDFLIQYCVGRGKRDFHYIESVARKWKEDNITTVSQAKKHSTKFEKNVYTVMKALGRSNAPTDEEAEFILRWLNEFGFELDSVKYACSKTVVATDSHRFEYCEGILKKWREKGLFTLDSIKAQEVKPDSSTPKRRSTQKVPKFVQFAQRDYDYDSLAKDLVKNM